MAKRFVRVDITNALKELEELGKAADQALEDMQIEVANLGRDKMVEYIETRGTGKKWGSVTRSGRFRPEPMPAKLIPLIGKFRSGSYPGRVNTGRMRDAVRVRFERGEKQIRSAFGWIDAPKDDEVYFKAQEYGFSAGGFRKPVPVQGMFALRDARLYVTSQLPRISEKYKKRLQRGKY